MYFRCAESSVPDTPRFPISYDAECDDHDSGVLWNSFPFWRSPQSLHRDIAFKVYADLFMIIWQGEKARQGVSGPHVTESSFQVIKDTHRRLLQWADQLPRVMVREVHSLPPVLDLQYVLTLLPLHPLVPILGLTARIDQSTRAVCFFMGL